MMFRSLFLSTYFFNEMYGNQSGEFARGSSTEHPPEAVRDDKALIFMTESLIKTVFHFEQSSACKTEVADP